MSRFCKIRSMRSRTSEVGAAARGAASGAGARGCNCSALGRAGAPAAPSPACAPLRRRFPKLFRLASSCGGGAVVAAAGLSRGSFCPSGVLFSLSVSCGAWADGAEEGGWHLKSSQTAKTKPRGEFSVNKGCVIK